MVSNPEHGTLTWMHSDMTGIVAVSSDCESGKVAVLTALGDLIIVDSMKRVPAKRFEEGSCGIPFISQHTRDGILAWGYKDQHKCVFLLKPGGALYSVAI